MESLHPRMYLTHVLLSPKGHSPGWGHPGWSPEKNPQQYPGDAGTDEPDPVGGGLTFTCLGSPLPPGPAPSAPLPPRPLPTLSSSGTKFCGCKSDCAFQGKNGEERWTMTPGEEAGSLPALFPGPGLSLLWEKGISQGSEGRGPLLPHGGLGKILRLGRPRVQTTCF